MSAGRTFLRSLLPVRSDLTAATRSPGRDLIAGLTVAIVALPLALAFGVASGLGAEAGLTTAVIAGALAAIFGGSNLQVSGPTGAMTVVLIPVVHEFGPSGVLQVGVMAGIILVALSVSGIGRYVRYLPSSLVEGFTAGIAVVIALQQLPNMLGVAPGGQERVVDLAIDAAARFVQSPDPIPVAIALGVAAVILLGARWKPAFPLSFVAVALATAVAYFLAPELGVVGELPRGIPAPSAGFFDPVALAALVPSAVAVAALAALESLLCATVADAMSVGQKHNPDRELFGQGIANLVVPFFGGVPATAAIARTAVNVRAGARSRLASLSHSIVLLLFILVAAPLVGVIPLAALGGVLLATTVQMVQVGAIRSILRSSRGDAIVLVITFGVTVAIDLVTAVIVGLALAGVVALRAVARSAQVSRVPLDESDHADEEQSLLDDRIVAFRLDGALFFGAAHRFLLELSEVTDVAVVILRMSRLSTIDATGALMLDDAIARLEKRGIVVLLSGIRPGHRKVLSALTSAPRLTDAGRVFADTPEAIEHARELAAR
ncbi:SulP family sulfate permease [Cryobacterium mesophilum]|uniref:SulP family inorganic anion transporter n=1 Tax=Terrimesophilobacter mesophilus TaxID=433647 RepID=A0A4R8VAI6_9MICO|nr:SulP family inorganic anion transporter [Terrimesophilobacter mesophilus]MBB5632168.1 SulP family sulfate permease [Terrimesophilobacter mesophilus]TFB79032.1 SulP family inorganic anion transporter [Terrimesophilobacter mesophilus]